MAKILNPFAYRLNGNKAKGGEYKVIYDTIGDRPVYRNGDYSIWKSASGYDTCWKNIIITQTTGAPKKLVDRMVTCVPPTDSVSFHHYNRMRQAINDGKRYAEKMGFEITNI